MSNPLCIERIAKREDIPFDLLLLADETLEAIGRYIHDSDIYVAKLAGWTNPVGVFVLQTLNSTEIEIKNMAVAAALQGNRLGTRLVDEIKQIARQGGWQTIWVGTPDCAIREIRFYEQNGFKKAGVKENFFIRNYADPIFDNGIRLKDMLMLKIEIS